MIRRPTRVRTRPRRKGPPPAAALPRPAIVRTAEEITLRSQLRDYATETVAATLDQMQRREEVAAAATPELAPYLATYFAGSRRTLLEVTAAILDDTPPPATLPRRPLGRRWRIKFSFPGLIPSRNRTEHPDGAA